jgi:ABC-type glycerol-3-phosphate transport system substrate-binding protein
LILAFASALLGSCKTTSGSSSELPDNTALSEELVWSTEFHKTEDFGLDISAPLIIGDAIYFFKTEAAVSTADTGEDSYVYEPIFYSCKLDGSDYAPISDYKPAYKPPFNANGTTDVSTVALLDADKLYVAESSSFTYQDEESGNYVADSLCSIRLLDINDGKEINRLDTNELNEKYPDINIDHMIMSPTGNVAIASQYLDMTTFTQKIVTGVFSADGAKCTISEYQPNQQTFILQALVLLPDGEITASIYAGDGHNALFYLDETTAELKDSGTSLPYSFTNIVGFTNDGSVLSNSLNGLELAKVNDETGIEFLNWLDCDLDINNTKLLGILDDTTIVCLTQNSGAMETEQSVVVITKTTKSEGNVKKELMLACASLPYSIQNEIFEFNKTDSEYRIKVIDYSKYNTALDVFGGQTKLNLDIISGNIPDIILLDGLPYHNYAKHGMLEDLYPYIEADNELGGKSGIVDIVFNTLESEEGSLYQIASSFGISTLLSNREFAGDGDSWSIDEMLTVLDNNEGMLPFGYTIREVLVEKLIQSNLDLFVNWQTGEVTFDSPEFRALLDLIETTPSGEEIQLDVSRAFEDEKLALNEWKQLCQIVNINTFEDFLETTTIMNGRDVYKGFPSPNESGSYVYYYDVTAITQNCADKPAAWRFVRRLLSKRYQSAGTYSFPTNQALFVELSDSLMKADIYNAGDSVGDGVEAAIDETYRLNSDGKYEIPKGQVSAISSQGEFLNYPYYSMTAEQFDRFVDLVGKVRQVAREDNTLAKIVTEETALYFSGQKGLDETLRVIQSRAKIYINEQL